MHQKLKKKNLKFGLILQKKNNSEFLSYKKIWDSATYPKKYDIATAKLKTEIKILKKLRRQKGFMYYWQRIAAILIIPILFTSLYLYFEESGITDTYAKTTETIKTPFGARTSLTLPDGSLIWLNSGSEISYGHNFNKTREVELKGEMYLEVKKGDNPFIVKTNYGNVTVLGTKFNVNAYDKEDFNTTLIEGVVTITEKKSGKTIRLEPGHQATISNGSIELKKVEASTYISWINGKLEFRREPFELVSKKLERWFNVKIELKGESIKKLWYTGTIEMESFSEVLELIKNTTPIEYTFNSKTRVLTIISKI